MKAIVTQIERGAAYDGPGLRTVVFFKGCPLKCFWCANPETQNPYNEVYFDSGLCMNCNECRRVCPQAGQDEIKRCLKCRKMPECGLCVKNCPTGALRIVGKEMNAQEIFSEVMKDELFYASSGGGVTLSGGEVLANAGVALEVLKLCKSSAIHTAIETSGFGSITDLAALAEYTDLFLFDIKHPEKIAHIAATGVDNTIILENLGFLTEKGFNVIIRLPLIPGFNDTPVAVGSLLQIMSSLGLKELHILPYHALARDKYRKLNRDFKEPGETPGLEPEAVAAAAVAAGINAKIGGIN